MSSVSGTKVCMITSLCVWVCACTWVHMFMYTGAHWKMCECIWRPQSSLKCHSFDIVHFVLFLKAISCYPRTHQMRCYGQLVNFRILRLQCWDYKHVPLCSAYSLFYMGVWGQTLVLILQKKHFADWVIPWALIASFTPEIIMVHLH